MLRLLTATLDTTEHFHNISPYQVCLSHWHRRRDNVARETPGAAFCLKGARKSARGAKVDLELRQRRQLHALGEESRCTAVKLP
jgi:hypothetical protein